MTGITTDFNFFTGHPMAWAIIAGAIACVAILAALLLLHEHNRMEVDTLALKAQAERNDERLFDMSEREERYRSLIEAQSDLIVRFDHNQHVNYVNSAFMRMFSPSHADQEAYFGRPLVLPVAQNNTPQNAMSRADGVREDEARLFDECYDLLGQKRWISWVETSLITSHGEMEIVRVGRDITERMLTLQGLQSAHLKSETASESKSRFLATVSHEVRTPLNGILGMAELLKDTHLSLEQRTYVDAMKTSGEALLSLIDEILDFSRIESGRLDLVECEFDLCALVESVVELLAPRAQGKGIEIAASIAPHIPQKVMGDQDRLRQVLMNLAGNAVKFTQTGGVGLIVNAKDNNRIEIEVADTGEGIPEDRLESIFGEFERVDGTASSAHEGAGLGLAISKRIVMHMKGSLNVASDVGHGSTFRLEIPLPECGSQEAKASLQPNAPSLAKLKTLIVSRSPFEAPFMSERLREAGAKVDRVMTVPHALRKLQTGAYELVIADCALGETSTRKIAQAAREHGVARSLVLLSPFERREFGSPTAAGFDGYLVKPVRVRSLFERITPTSSIVPSAHVIHATALKTLDTLPTRRVLIAEDNEINALLLTKMLEKLGAQADWVSNGRLAVDKMVAAISGKIPMYDCAILDIRMPGLDGLQVARLMRTVEEERGVEPLHLIALTANVFPEDRNAALNAGFNTFMPKPLSYEHLKELINTLPYSTVNKDTRICA
jgi:PAS domain S-box-containing protein